MGWKYIKNFNKVVTEVGFSEWIYLLYKIAKNQTGKGDDYRIVELNLMHEILSQTDVDDNITNELSECFVILSNYNNI
jgi:hypothetical protein